jgi:hypothetical protein
MSRCRGTYLGVLASFLLLFFASSIALAATQYPVDKLKSVIPLYGKVLHFPVPSWIDGSAASIQELMKSKLFRKQLKDQFIFEQVQSHETFAHWTQLYAVFAFLVRNDSMNLDWLVTSSIEPFTMACGKDNLKIKTIDSTENAKTIQVFCMNSPFAPKDSGYGSGIGEIGLFHFLVKGDLLVKVYQEWRGKQYTMSDTFSWPVKPATIKEMQRRFKTIHLI